MNLKTALGQLRALAILEGASYLMLFGITMPLKYIGEIGGPNKLVGMTHGVLFIMYCLWVVYYAKKKNWPILKTLLALGASLLPFATFIVDRKYLKND
tara:strand:- start:4324 stop:4617 length:294 start_codon:yes stop_codon:yes gene_type:complete